MIANKSTQNGMEFIVQFSRPRTYDFLNYGDGRKKKSDRSNNGISYLGVEVEKNTTDKFGLSTQQKLIVNYIERHFRKHKIHKEGWNKLCIDAIEIKKVFTEKWLNILPFLIAYYVLEKGEEMYFYKRDYILTNGEDLHFPTVGPMGEVSMYYVLPHENGFYIKAYNSIINGHI